MDRVRNILLADDESRICSMLLDMLPDCWRVTVTHSGDEVYALLCNCRGRYDLAIVDVHMPGMGGDESLELARAFGADLPVLYISGDLGFRVPEGDKIRILHKPFSMADLMGTLGFLLGEVL